MKNVIYQLDSIRSLEQPNYVELEKFTNGRLVRAMYIALVVLTDANAISETTAIDVLSNELCNEIGDEAYVLLNERFEANMEQSK